MTITLTITAIVVCLLIVGLFHTSLRRILTDFFAPVRDAGLAAVRILAGVRTRLEEAYRTFRRNEGMEAPNRFASFFIGAIFYTGLFLVFFAADYNLVALTLNAMFATAGAPTFYGNVEVLSAVVLIAAGAFWILVLTDIGGKTHLVPWNRLGPVGRYSVSAIAVVCFGMTLALGAGLGFFRSDVLLQSHALEQFDDTSVDLDTTMLPGDLTTLEANGDPDVAFQVSERQQQLTQAAMVGLPALALVSGGFAGFGPYMLLLFAWMALLKVLQAGVWFVEFTLAFLLRTLTVVFGFLDSLLEFVCRVGIFLTMPLGYVSAIAAKTDVNVGYGEQRDSGVAVPTEPAPAEYTSTETETEEPDEVMEIVEDSDTSPSRNWGPFGGR